MQLCTQCLHLGVAPRRNRVRVVEQIMHMPGILFHCKMFNEIYVAEVDISLQLITPLILNVQSVPKIGAWHRSKPDEVVFDRFCGIAISRARCTAGWGCARYSWTATIAPAVCITSFNEFTTVRVSMGIVKGRLISRATVAHTLRVVVYKVILNKNCVAPGRFVCLQVPKSL